MRTRIQQDFDRLRRKIRERAEMCVSADCGHNQDQLGSESSAAAPQSFPREAVWGLWVSTL